MSGRSDDDEKASREHEAGGRDQQKEARVRLDEMEARLEGLFDAVSGSFREMSERLQSAFGATSARDGGNGVRIERHIRVGTILDDDGKVLRPSTVSDAGTEPEYEIRQNARQWSLQCQLPGVTLSELNVSFSSGWLRLGAGPFQLDLALPGNLDIDAMEMRLADGVLNLIAPRGKVAP